MATVEVRLAAFVRVTEPSGTRHESVIQATREVPTVPLYFIFRLSYVCVILYSTCIYIDDYPYRKISHFQLVTPESSHLPGPCRVISDDQSQLGPITLIRPRENLVNCKCYIRMYVLRTILARLSAPRVILTSLSFH